MGNRMKPSRSSTTREIISNLLQHSLPGGAAINEYSNIVIDHAENAYIWDTDGNRYIDFFTGVGVSNIGHSHPKFLTAVSKQLARCTVGSFYTEVRAQLQQSLAALLPSNLQHIHMYSTGSEAVEAAVRFARAASGREEIISFWGGFHGKTQGAMSLHAGPRKRDAGPFPTGSHHVPYAYCFRCPLNLKFPGCHYACVELARNSIKESTANNVAAIIIEPVQGTNGNIVPPAGYLKEIRKLADEFGALLIFDEVITGFGRTGRFFAFEHEDVVPDILVLGKAMGSGVPVSAVISDAALVENTSFSLPSAASSTFGGNPLASAAALATIEIIRDEHLVERSCESGKLAESIMKSWSGELTVIGNTGISGLMIGLELVYPGTNRPLSADVMRNFFSSVLHRGIIAMAYGSRIRLYPPLSINDSDLKEGLLTLYSELQCLAQFVENYPYKD
ncbi:4-aminobutyrate aminotransferase/4-aminobutyrate aminotransferase/(S)-3-amino-2-methylpropionate transaminase [Erwinia toletana]|uniref:4-aminobutyrate aminotransferase/4-aminobutyrate aminotransferase/(S)-3-amino-2-methylpropionate transaminase n=1 Tax=Winslowiella toletana TaxID=92490 RepID=A0ABS4P5C1_9GAMM|nr:aspartate aminotransferase family protein [Winslowiella toletana]MBP2167392.1 4-aminobutyrate aminotransferase/4-aminobutyrate aminotransferase/(S)-3-amino-2-methylpropionate transaminase [Winslowiella toletana]